MTVSFTYETVRDFLYREARHLDDKQWDEWLACYAPEASYWLPAWDDHGVLTDDPQSQISLIWYGNRGGLEDRVFRVRTGRSSASNPDTRTSHNINNIEITEQDGATAQVRFNWHTMSFRYKIVDHYFGTSYYTLELHDGAPRIVAKKIVLKNDHIRQLVDFYLL